MRRTFTLIEVVIALGILALMAVVALTTLQTSFGLRDWLEEEDATDRAARVTMQRVSRELKLAYLTPTKTSVNTYRTVFVGIDEGDSDRVWFATLAHQRLYRNSREGDQAEITLWTDEDPAGDGLALLHREAAPIDEKPDQGGVILPLATGVRKFNLRYLDSERNEWVDDWDSQKAQHLDRLPRAVEITLVLDAPDPDDDEKSLQKTYLTTVLLDLAEPMKRSLLARGGG